MNFIQYADGNTYTTAPAWLERSLSHAHPEIVAAINRNRSRMGLGLVQTRGNPLAPSPRRKQGSPREQLAAAKAKALVAIQKLRRLQAGR